MARGCERLRIHKDVCLNCPYVAGNWRVVQSLFGAKVSGAILFIHDNNDFHGCFLSVSYRSFKMSEYFEAFNSRKGMASFILSESQVRDFIKRRWRSINTYTDICPYATEQIVLISNELCKRKGVAQQ